MLESEKSKKSSCVATRIHLSGPNMSTARPLYTFNSVPMPTERPYLPPSLDVDLRPLNQVRTETVNEQNKGTPFVQFNLKTYLLFYRFKICLKDIY